MVILRGSEDRARATSWIAKAASGTRIEFKSPKRSLPQNDLMWSLLTEVSRQKEHCGRKYTPDQWKVLFMHACGRELQAMPSLDGASFVPWGYQSSDLSKDEMSELIEFIYAWGAQNGVAFKEDGTVAA